MGVLTQLRGVSIPKGLRYCIFTLVDIKKGSQWVREEETPWFVFVWLVVFLIKELHEEAV